MTIYCRDLSQLRRRIRDNGVLWMVFETAGLALGKSLWRVVCNLAVRVDAVRIPNGIHDFKTLSSASLLSPDANPVVECLYITNKMK